MTLMDKIMAINSTVNGIVWGIPMLILIVGTGIYMTVKLNFFQFRHFGYAMKNTIGKVLDKTNTQLVADLKNGVITPEEAAVSYDYTAPLVMLACLGIAALVLGFILKIVDKKKGLGLEEPNIKA